MIRIGIRFARVDTQKNHPMCCLLRVDTLTQTCAILGCAIDFLIKFKN